MLIKNGFVVTLDGERRVIRDGAVAVEGDQIVAVGKTDALLTEWGSEDVMDATGKIVMPGLVNAHNHVYQTIMRGTSDDRRRGRTRRSLYRWNIDLLEGLDKKACHAAGKLAAVEMIRSGVTTTQDSHYINFHRDSIDGVAESILESGLRLVLGRGCWDVEGLAPPELTEDIPGAMKESRKVISRWHGAGDGRINVRIEASLVSQCTDEMIKATKALADEHSIGWAIHHQERLGTSTVDPRRGDPGLDKFEGRAIEYLDFLGVLDPASLLVHSTFADETEIDILARTGAAVAHCPVANAWGGRSQITAVPSMLRAGVSVGLGTDGALTNDSLDLFQAMKFCALIHKVNHGDATVMTAEKVIELSTIDSAKALQMDGSVGSLEPGKKADIILLNKETPGLTPGLLPVKNIVYSAASGRSVDTVIVDGKTVMEDGVITTFDEAEAYRAGEEAAWKMMEQSGILERDPDYLNPSPWRYE